MSDNDELKDQLERLYQQARQNFFAGLEAMGPGNAAYILGLTDTPPMVGFKSWDEFDAYIHAGDAEPDAGGDSAEGGSDA